MAAREAAGVFVGTRREEEVPLECAQLDAVGLALVDHHEGIPARGGIHAPADVTHAVGLFLVEGGEIRAQQVGIEIVAIDVDDTVIGDRQTHRVAHVLLEGEVDIARCQHDRAVDRTRRRKRDDQAARPVRDRARSVGRAPRASGEGASEADSEVGAGGRGDMYLVGTAQALEPRKYARLERPVVGRPALEGLGILVGDHQHARASTEDGGQLGRVQQALDRAVEDEVGGAERGDSGGVALQCDARARRADRHRARVGRRWHADIDDTAAEVLGGQACNIDERGAAHRLAQDSDDLAGSQTTRDECATEDIERAVLHQAASTMSTWSRSRRLSAAGASNGVRCPTPGITSRRAPGMPAASASL